MQAGGDNARATAMDERQNPLGQARQEAERRTDDRRETPANDEELWRWMNMVLNGNERRAAVGRRADDRW